MENTQGESELPVITATYNLPRPHHEFYDKKASNTERVNTHDKLSKKRKRNKTVINVVNDEKPPLTKSYALESETGQRTLTGSNEFESRM